MNGGDELVLAVRERQGFVVVAARRPTPLGFVFPQLNLQTLRLVVSGPATAAEFHAQLKLMEELLGMPLAPAPPGAEYFYRVEAAD